MRSKNKLKTWACPEKCKNNSSPCQHLQKLLPGVDSGIATRAIKQTMLDIHYSGAVSSVDREDSIKHLRLKLLKIGLKTEQADLLIDKFISNLSLKEISDKSGYVSGAAVNYFLKNTISYLRTIGYPHLAKVFYKENK